MHRGESKGDFLEDMRRILLVDDEEAIVFAFGKILKNSSVEIDQAQSLDEVNNLLGTHTYIAVITDLRLSGVDDMDGLVVIRECRRRMPEAKIISITAYGGDEVERAVYDAGADSYMEKPVSADRIRTVLESMNVL
jgi:two-component system response regulator HydG